MDLNRLKIVLVEKKRTRKWLVEVLAKNEAVVFGWSANVSLQSLETRFTIAKVLNVNVKEL